MNYIQVAMPCHAQVLDLDHPKTQRLVSDPLRRRLGARGNLGKNHGQNQELEV